MPIRIVQSNVSSVGPSSERKPLTKGQRSKRYIILSVLAVHRPFYISIWLRRNWPSFQNINHCVVGNNIMQLPVVDVKTKAVFLQNVVRHGVEKKVLLGGCSKMVLTVLSNLIIVCIVLLTSFFIATISSIKDQNSVLVIVFNFVFLRAKKDSKRMIFLCRLVHVDNDLAKARLHRRFLLRSFSF